MIALLRTGMAVAYLLLVVPPAALIAFPWTFISGKIDFLYWLAMKLVRSGLWVIGIKTKVVGMENVDPKGTYVFMSNHVSNIDPPILVPLIPRRTSLLGKKEVWRIPILASALNMADIVPVERHNRDSAIQSIRKAGEVMRQGINMSLYPEGTRSADGRLLPFKKGPFHLAMETGFPIVPVTMLNTYEMMPKGSTACKAGTVTVVFHPPIDPKQFSSREELMQTVHDVINSALPEERR
jgi:1-acyl-sn-glycerol-3-phosphate acyltransferase